MDFKTNDPVLWHISKIGKKNLFVNGKIAILCVTFGYFNSLQQCSALVRILELPVLIRDRPRFLDLVGHQTTYASTGNKYFFTK